MKRARLRLLAAPSSAHSGEVGTGSPPGMRAKDNHERRPESDPMNLLKQLEAEQMKAVRGGKGLPEFRPGDTLKVNVKVVEQTWDEKAKQMKTRERLQAFEGVCIGRQGDGLNESFTVRKISYGEGVERVFPIFSPLVDSVQVVRKGRVRRAKLYYLRGRRGKSARIAERTERGEAASESPTT